MKIPKSERQFIRLAYEAGATQTQLAKDYGVTRHTIQYIVNTADYSYKPKSERDHREMLIKWNRMAKKNHEKISNRPDAVKLNG